MALANFYVNHSDKLEVEKDLSAIRTNQEITVIEPVSISDPIIKLSKNIGSLSFNYIYIADFGRFYTLTEPPTWNNGFYTAKLHVDVLMTFKSGFYTKKAVIKRNSRNYNLYLNDEHMKMYNYPFYQTFNMKCTEGTPFKMQTNQIVLALVGAV